MSWHTHGESDVKITVSLILLILAVIAFAIGAIRPGVGGFSWTDAGLALVAASWVAA